MVNTNCTIINKTKSKLPRLPFVSIKESILGVKYDLELIFVTGKEQLKINKFYRNKDTTTNILSFPLSKTSGQIFIDPKKANLEKKEFDMSYTQFIKYLFIHGLLHLKGFDHGSIMEREENKYLKKFSK